MYILSRKWYKQNEYKDRLLLFSCLSSCKRWKNGKDRMCLTWEEKEDFRSSNYITTTFTTPVNLFISKNWSLPKNDERGDENDLFMFICPLLYSRSVHKKNCKTLLPWWNKKVLNDHLFSCICSMIRAFSHLYVHWKATRYFPVEQMVLKKIMTAHLNLPIK